VEHYLAGSVKLEVVAGLRNACASLEETKTADGHHEFLVTPGGRKIHITLDYEVDELERDRFFFEHGEDALYRYVADRVPDLPSQLSDVQDLLRPAANARFITDRDGTVNNYCGRYRSSVQSAYNAILLTRFARKRTSTPVMLTSAPLEGFGLVDLTTMPDGAFLLAGSKGREFRDPFGHRRRLPADPEKGSRLEELNSRITALLETPEYEEFGLIGSAVQFKLGETTVARQDMYGSIPTERSQSFLERIRALVAELDPGGEVFRVEDTGYDIEIILTRDEGDRDFNKGDGIDFIDAQIGLGLDGPTVVCGDTSSDVSMVERVAATSADLRSIFVTTDDELKRRVESVAPRCVFVDSPDVLVLALGAQEEE
ncbi:MAG: hypothetical protein ACLFNX_09510, partial [Spirochaetaceae bacterium]